MWIVKPSSGKITVENFDIIDDYRETRSRIGLVPQELTLEQFETVLIMYHILEDFTEKNLINHIEKF